MWMELPKRAIPYAANTLKDINLISDLNNEFASTFCNDKDFTLGYLFRGYIESYVQNTNQTPLI